MNLILDMDGTLINEKKEPRPHLQAFFHYIFQHFERVSIWTAALDVWFNDVYQHVFKPLIPKGKSFHFVWCRDKCKLLNIGSSTMIVKPLSKIYNSFPNFYNQRNTLIIDDTHFTYRENIGNAIKISSYSNNRSDTELVKIIQQFQHRIFNQSKMR